MRVNVADAGRSGRPVLGPLCLLDKKKLFVLLTETDSVTERIIHLQLQPPRQIF